MCNIKLETYNEIIDKIGNAPIESGGILGMKNDVICAFFYDENAKTSCDTYIPDIASLNEVIKNWNRQGVKFVGIVHSHANGYDKPSHNDELYAKKLLEHSSLTVSQVCRESGFDDYPNFVRRFSARFGSSPSKMRK